MKKHIFTRFYGLLLFTMYLYYKAIKQARNSVFCPFLACFCGVFLSFWVVFRASRRLFFFLCVVGCVLAFVSVWGVFSPLVVSLFFPYFLGYMDTKKKSFFFIALFCSLFLLFQAWDLFSYNNI